MSTEPTQSLRDQELRRMLVATSTAEPVRPQRRSAVMASLAAFVMAGALTGGAVSAVALSADDRPATVSIDEMKNLVVYDDAQLYGTPFVLSGQGTTTIQLGDAPEGAKQIAVAFHCDDAGTFRVLVDGELQGESRCSEEDTADTNGGGYHSITGDGEHTLTIDTARSNRFVVWTSWANRATAPEPSAAQNAALSDGVVTETEYRDGFARYDGCMINAGSPLVGVDQSGTLIKYSNTGDSVTSGVEGRCYALEFTQLDSAWQIQNEDTSETANRIGACLTARGITPESTMAGRNRQLEAIPLTIDQCLTGL